MSSFVQSEHEEEAGRAMIGLSMAMAVATFAIHDLTPDFWRFWEAAQNQPVEQQVRLWQQLNVAPHPLWTALWAEGMAMYVSKQLNPSASELDLGLVPLGMARQVDERRADVAADFLRKFGSTAEKDATLYFNSNEKTDAVVPPRAGYQLGVLVVRDLSKRYSIQTLAHWSQPEAKPQVRAALERIAATRGR